VDTTHDVQQVTTAQIRRERLGRRVFTASIVIFLVLGMLGVFGVRTRTISSGDVSLTYAQVTRRGLAAPWTLELSSRNGFTDEIEVRTSSSYLDAVQVDDLEPEPASSSTVGDVVVWTFDPPDGDIFRLSMAAHTGANGRAGRKGATTSVLVGGEPVGTLSYRTWVLP
jgi:hypothetical protein